LADENLPRDAVDALRAAGHDVLWIATDFAGLSDPSVLTKAVDDGRVLVTFDKDFGELVFRGHQPTVGIGLFRIVPMSVDALVTLVLTVLPSRDDWIGYFSVIKRGRIRRVPLSSLNP